MIIIFCCIAGFIFMSFAWALCRVAATPTPKIHACTRRAPHECTVNGPCNGLPRRGTYANGRPTMPSEFESELEMERRTR